MFDAEPHGWRAGRLGDLISEVVSRVDPVQNGDPNQPYIGLEHIGQATGRLTGSGSASEVVSQKSRFEPGDILYGKLRPNLRKVARPDFGGLCSTDIVVFRAKAGTDPDFAFQLLQSEDLVAHAVASAAGTKMPRTHARSVLAFEAAIPPLNEQRRIAEVLRAVDEALTAEERVLDGLARLRAAAIERFIAEASLRETARLSEITASMDAGWSPDCENNPALEGEWAILKTSAVTWAGYHDEQNKRLPIGLSPRPSLSVEVGDILITRAGPADRTGVVAMVDQTLGRRMLSDKLIRVRVDDRRAVPLTIATILGSLPVQSQIGRVKSGMAASQTNISQRIVAGLEIPLPPLEDQRRFASFVEAIDQQSRLSTAQWKRLSVTKTRIANDLLSGHVRVPHE